MSTSFAARPASYNAPAAVSNAPQGTFLPGTKVQVGNHRVIIEKYLSEGGFAHVYVVKVPRSGTPDKHDIAVLKRVAVPDKDALANMRTEVETMKKLKGHKRIVTYMDSHASALKEGGYEVFLLMEYCQGGGLIDFMNTRLQHRLTEPEILKIFSDAAEGVACMHYLKPPLLHRDLKVENILISTSGSSRVFKLCDFGSTAPPRPAATTAAEGRLIEDDIQRHTTMQYRSPEMVDVYRKLPIDEKSDIWALGVLLYKLCFYTTPFEDQGQMAILNATFKYPSYPSFSDRIKRLIGSMLREHPGKRPNIYQVLAEVCSMRGTAVPIKDIYTHRTQSEDRRNQRLPEPESVASPPVAGIQKVQVVQEVQKLPDIIPMRRGRPTASSQAPDAKSSSSTQKAASNDPFAALDSTSAPVRAAAADALASRFPSLDEFSILHDKGSKFEFSSRSSPVESKQSGQLSQRVTSALADEAFAKAAPSSKQDNTQLSKVQSVPARTTSLKQEAPSTSRPAQSPRILPQTQARGNMISTAVGSSPPPSPKLKPKPTKYPDVNNRPIWRVPAEPGRPERAMSRTGTGEGPRRSAQTLQIEKELPPRPTLAESRRSKSSALDIPKSPASSRPSLEGSRPLAQDLGDGIHRSRSANVRPRPTSMHLESNMDFLRERESSRTRPSIGDRSRPTSFVGVDPNLEIQEKSNITSDVDYLKAIEDDDPHKKHRRSSSKHKRASIPSISLSNTKSMFAGKFSDAFRKFESSPSQSQPHQQQVSERQRPRTPSPDPSYDRRRQSNLLTPIAGSEATDGRSEDGSERLDETQELPPEVRRELERRALEQEERRVAEAAAQYQARVARGVGKSAPSSSRGSAIQNRVKDLLDESKKAPPPPKTAEGYGKYTDANRPPQPPRPGASGQNAPPLVQRTKPAAVMSPIPPASAPPALATMAAPALQTAPMVQRTGPRPSAPPKPKALRTGASMPPSTSASRPTRSPTKPSTLSGKPIAAQIYEEGEVVAGQDDDWAEDFSKRYPSLGGLDLEMVEADIGGGTRGVRDF